MDQKEIWRENLRALAARCKTKKEAAEMLNMEPVSGECGSGHSFNAAPPAFASHLHWHETAIPPLATVEW